MDTTGLSNTLLVRFLGLYLLYRILYYFLYSIYDIIKTHLFTTDLRNFGEWAVVTGATDGIGKELARSLAKNGLNIVLISRNEAKLELTAHEIEEDFNVKTIWVQADFGNRDCYNNIEKAIINLDIGILVNNVGTLLKEATSYAKISINELWSALDINCGSITIMTRLILPHMKAKNKGLIVNIGSMAAKFGLPGTGIYAPTKSFISMFTLNLQEEVAKNNIKVRCLIPGYVNTKLLGAASASINKLKNKNNLFGIFVPSAHDYAQYAINSITSDFAILTGFWAHTILVDILCCLPIQLKIKISNKIIQFITVPKLAKRIKDEKHGKL